MYIHKRVLILLGLLVVGLAAFQLGILSTPVNAQQGVVPYNARYLFTGSETEPAMFDTNSGIYRVWSPNDKKTVTTYDFVQHKIVAVDSLSYR